MQNLDLIPKRETPVPGTGSFSKQTPDSSSVSSIAYDAKTAVFTIVFKRGNATYDYKGVSQKDATAAYNSHSYGALSHNELRAYTGVKREI
jgi:hypothetical protein